MTVMEVSVGRPKISVAMKSVFVDVGAAVGLLPLDFVEAEIACVFEALPEREVGSGDSLIAVLEEAGTIGLVAEAAGCGEA